MSLLDQDIWYRFISEVKGLNFALAPTQYTHFKHPFLQRLQKIILDTQGSGLDLAYAIRDVLACVAIQTELYGVLNFVDSRLSTETNTQAGIKQDHSGNFALISDQVTYSEVYQKAKRRFIRALPLDPILQSRFEQCNIHAYNGEGQRQAIRSILSSDNNSTIFVQLPTGCGKTLLIHALSLLQAQQRLILVIVPTVGLGIEQAQRAQEVLSQAGLDHQGSYVWHSQLASEERLNIRQRMNAGTQRILFCSPEIAISALRAQLFDLAQHQLLDSIFIDEAHLIDTWGTEFRPEFQLLAALTRSLRTYQKTLRVVLMSATFAQSTWDLLKQLFQDSRSPLVSVNGGFLRPEIQFNVLKTQHKFEHTEKVLACLQQLPRPIILYSVKRDDAEDWYQTLRELGFSRVGLFHGETKIQEREKLIQAWKDNQIDIMVATSAFGVGMDKSDIHSVLHTAVPENMDRFYQEAGRGGRDGAACLSWLIYYEEQIKIAENLAETKLISVEKGHKNWLAMCQTAVIEANNLLRVSLGSFKNELAKRTDYSLAWNIRTLLLMQRAGFIQLQYMPKPVLAADASEEEKQIWHDGYQDQIHIKVLKDSHVNQNAWQNGIGNQRKIEKQQQRLQLQQLLEWLQAPQTPLCQYLQQFYALDGNLPEKSCGGCPGCQKQGKTVFTPTLGQYVYHSSLVENDLFNEIQYLYYPATRPLTIQMKKLYLHGWKDWIERLIQNQTIGAIRASRETLTILGILIQSHFWAGISFDEPAIGVAELVLILPTEDFSQLRTVQHAPLQIIVAPDNLPDAQSPHRLWWATKTNSQSLSDFQNRGR
ncbi:protein DpdF [Acinetobacter sp. YH16052]|uniref:protein DpdF n=1 Tax=Acinetobacter sp. YH16052 TaxID=2601191 RepID=UPI0015D29571|nr:protein DpdF [Acinetobacter sp. YH16052]